MFRGVEMHFKGFIYVVGITTHIMSVVTLPTAGKSSLDSIHLYLFFELQKLTPIQYRLTWDPSRIRINVSLEIYSRGLRKT